MHLLGIGMAAYSQLGSSPLTELIGELISNAPDMVADSEFRNYVDD